MEPETMLTQDDDVLSRLNQESSEFEMESNFPDVDSINDDEDNDGILSQHMDIREPLTELRNLLEQRLTADFSDYTFWLQDSQELEGHKNLVEQCIQGEGLVQVNVQIKTHQKRINIVDVLKAADDYPEVSETNVNRQETNETNVTIRWTIDIPYKQEQERLKIPADPDLWTQTHVKHWLQWAVRQFNLKKLRLNDWNITGAELCALELPQFQSKVPEDPGDVFWTHLQLLKKCKFVAVIERSNEMDENSKNTASKSLPSMNSIDHSAKESSPSSASGQSTSSQTNKATNNGQIQLWQFLLELLTNRNHRDIILWEGTEGEFRLHRPETVAQLWGERKNKPSMNYEKLSRALRYYYEGDMISKVSGKRFAYKFDCDLKSILGYSAAELSRLVNGQKRNPDSENDIL